MTEAKALRGLYAITPEDIDDARLITQVDGALRGGVKFLQYRDKRRDLRQQTKMALALRGLCQRYGARLIINDHLQLALAVDADGLHLGGADGDLAAARQTLGPGKLLGASCYADFELARQAQAAGADYVAFGAVYASPTKPLAIRAPHQLFARCRAELGVPTCAIGGITLANGAALVAAGADLLAVITDLFAAPDIAARAAAFTPLFAGERT